jgi:hypothetical protein
VGRFDADVFSRNFGNFGLNDGTGWAGSVGARFKRGGGSFRWSRRSRAELRRHRPDRRGQQPVNVGFEGSCAGGSRAARYRHPALRTTEFSPVSNYGSRTSPVAWLQQIDALGAGRLASSS